MTSAPHARAPDDVFGLIGCTLDKRIRIESIVAEGGFGVVYYGTQLALEKPVAVKVLKTPHDLTETQRHEFTERFALEARTVARLAHPNIVQAVDFGVMVATSGHTAPWMALEWASGKTLSQMLAPRRGKGGQKPREVLAIVRPILQALSYAHDMGIAHRDVKPSNIMVSETRRDVVPRLMDFGIAKVMESEEVDPASEGWGEEKTTSTQRVFSLRYAAPEQISGTRSGPWTDVHAMALIIVEMLTDDSPYQCREVTALYGEILSPTRPTPAKRSLNAGAWEAVLHKALSLNPTERFRHAADFLAALEAEVPNAIVLADGLGPGTATRSDGSGAWAARNNTSTSASPNAVAPAGFTYGGAPMNAMNAMNAGEVSAPAGTVTGTGFSGSFAGAPAPNGGSRWKYIGIALGIAVFASAGTAWMLRVPRTAPTSQPPVLALPPAAPVAQPMPPALPTPAAPIVAQPAPPVAPVAPVAISDDAGAPGTLTTAPTPDAPAEHHAASPSRDAHNAGTSTGHTGQRQGGHTGGRHAVNFSVD